MQALSVEELLAWSDRTAEGWRALLTEHPEALDLPCDVREGETVRDLVQHIVAAELRYAERLVDRPATSYDQISKADAAALFATHDTAMEMLRQVVARADVDWEETLDFQTRSAGVLRASRRTILVHMLMHGIRHYAQLAMLVRQGGIAPGWGMDYLFMGLG